MVSKHVCLLAFLFTAALAATDESDDSSFLSEEMRLYNKLLSEKYNPHLRPVRKTNVTTVVNFGISIINILGVDEKSQSITLQIWLRKSWKDFNLQWNPDDYGGIRKMLLPHDKIWRPDIILYNSASDRYNYIINPNALVDNTGVVLFIPPLLLEASCRFDLTYFPFDTQMCTLKFGSWTYNGFQVDLQFFAGEEKPDLTNFRFHHEWLITESTGKRVDVYYPCCKQPYPDISYNLTLSRIDTYYVYMFVLPAVLTALLIPFLFLLPSRQQQKFTLGGCLLICLCLLLNKLDNIVPATEGSLPILGQYYMSAFFMLSLSLVLSIVTNNMAEKSRGLNQPPKWLKSIVLGCLARLLCVSYADYSTFFRDPTPVTFNQLRVRSTNDSVGVSLDDDEQQIVTSSSSRPYEIVEWRLIGVVLDRLFFLIFLVFDIIFILAFLAR